MFQLRNPEEFLRHNSLYDILFFKKPLFSFPIPSCFSRTSLWKTTLEKQNKKAFLKPRENGFAPASRPLAAICSSHPLYSLPPWHALGTSNPPGTSTPMSWPHGRGSCDPKEATQKGAAQDSWSPRMLLPSPRNEGCTASGSNCPSLYCHVCVCWWVFGHVW